MAYFRTVTQMIDAQLAYDPDQLKALQAWFREASDPVFQKSPLMTRTRAWPEGYPGDYVTLEAVYQKKPWAKHGVGRFLDEYFLRSTLAVGVRSRMRKLTTLLNYRAKIEKSGGNWLNIACGPCRELLSIPCKRGRTTWCIDTDEQSLLYAQKTLGERPGEKIVYLHENAFRLVKADRNLQRFGELTTIYSVGLFDYIDTEKLVKLLASLYESLAPGGALIGSFKDKYRYDTFDYHWLVKWDFFFQRSEPECFSLFDEAGIPTTHLTMVRDDSGVILFFIATK
jgi:SAM-dependent methyltransferase